MSFSSMSDTMDEVEDQSHMFGKNLSECVSFLSHASQSQSAILMFIT